MLPVDNMVEKSLITIPKVSCSVKIPDGWMGMDIGPETIKLYSEAIKKAKTSLNGPMGDLSLQF